MKRIVRRAITEVEAQQEQQLLRQSIKDGEYDRENPFSSKNRNDQQLPISSQNGNQSLKNSNSFPSLRSVVV